MDLNCSECEKAIYNFAKYKDNGPMPMAHLVTPFHIYFVTQNVWLSLLIIYLYESVSTLVRTGCNHFDICADPVSAGGIACNGHALDNLFSDIHQGFFGVLLAVLFYTVLDIPRWTGTFRETMATGTNGFWWKRLLFLILLIVPSQFNHLENLHLGVTAYTGSVTVVFIIFYYWNKTRREREIFWTDPETKQFSSSLYDWLYVAGALISITLMMSWLLPFTEFTYIKVSTVWLTIWFILVVCGIAKNRLAQIFDLHTLGLYSSCSRKRKTRFRWNKDRFVNYTNKSESKKTTSMQTVEDVLKRKLG